MEKLRVLVADDSIVYRKILTSIINNAGLGQVEQTASSGAIALERLAQQKFDLVLLDQYMPELTGIQVLAEIRKNYPETAVIMVSDGGPDGVLTTVTALEMGALDFIVKPSEGDPDKNYEMLKNHLQVLMAQLQIKKFMTAPQIVKLDNGVAPKSTVNRIKNEPVGKVELPELIVIAASTGGPAALEEILSGLVPTITVPVIVVQHMPPDFTKVLAESLAKKSPLTVVEATAGEAVMPGKVLVAPGGYHLVVELDKNSRLMVQTQATPYVNGVRPAADVLFYSIAQIWPGRNILVLILTGMGNDGLRGTIELKQKCNCYCITQSESTCTIYGMPKSLVEAGYSDEILDLTQIASRINQIAAGRC